MDVVPVLVGWVLWFGATAVILRVDAARQRAAAEERGEADFAQRSPAAYLGLAVLCGPLPLLVYFWATRKSAAGVLLGLAWAAAVTLLGGGVVVGVEKAAALAAPAMEPAMEAVRTWPSPDTSARSDDGFARLKEVPEARLLGGIWPQHERTVRDGEGRGTLTFLHPSGAILDADRLRYMSDAGVEVDLDVAAP